MGEPAVGADEERCAGDDGALRGQVAGRVDPGQRAENSLARGRLGIEVLVDDDAGVEEHDWTPAGESLDDVVDDLSVLRGVRERVAEVEADGRELVREPLGGLGLRPGLFR